MKGRAIAWAVLCGAVVTAVILVLDFYAAIVIYDWSGADPFSGERGGKPPASWALPTWLLLTLAFLVVDALVIRWVYRRLSR